MGVVETLVALAFIAYLGVVLLVLGEGGELWRIQTCRFECPFLHESVECRIVQDARSRRWQQAIRCSAFPAGPPACAQDCLASLNVWPAMRGALAGTGAGPSA